MADMLRIIGMSFDWHNPHSSSKLARAVRARNMVEVKRLLKMGTSPDIPDNRGFTALHEASRSDEALEFARVLLSSGAYIEHKTVEGETPLFVACSYSCEKIVELYLSNNCIVNNVNIDSATPLHIACSKKNYNIIRMLINAGANVNAQDNEMLTPIFYAIQFENAEAVRLLIEAGCDTKAVDYFSRSPLQFSCMVGNLGIFDTLIEHLGLSKALVNHQTSDGWTLLMEAVQFKNYNIAEKLISYGADTSLVDSRGMLALHLAAHCNRTDCLELIIRHTPKDVIERYATTKENLTHTRSLPCLLIDKNMFDGLKLLFEFGVSDEVLSCPARMGDNLVSPVSFLFLHGSNIEPGDKVKYLDLLLSKEALKDPVYVGHDIPVTRSADAAVRGHKTSHNHCNCDVLLSMLLNEGVNPDVRATSNLPQPFVNAVSSCYIRGLSLLLIHSNTVEPEDVLLHSFKRYASPDYEWNKQEDHLTKYLVWASSSSGLRSIFPAIARIVDTSPAANSAKIAPLYETIKAKTFQLSSLKVLSRRVIRSYLRGALSEVNPRTTMRNIIKSQALPRALIDYVMYEDFLAYPNVS